MEKQVLDMVDSTPEIKSLEKLIPLLFNIIDVSVVVKLHQKRNTSVYDMQLLLHILSLKEFYNSYASCHNFEIANEVSREKMKAYLIQMEKDGAKFFIGTEQDMKDQFQKFENENKG